MRRGAALAAFALAAGAVAPVGAQAPAAAAAPAGARSATDSLTSSYEVGGIRVIHRRNTANEVVAANVYLLGGTRQTTDANAGIEAFLLEASERGTTEYPKERLRRTMNRLGSAIATAAEADWTMLGLRATRQTFDSTWAVLASRLMSPTLDSAEVELVREQFVLGLRQRNDSPDALVTFLADSFAFQGHPYARPPTGNARSIASISLADLRRYQREHIVKSRLLVVIVGNVERPTVERLLTRTLAKLPAGSYAWTLPDTLPRRASGFVTVARQLPTNYIQGYYPGPPAGSRDYAALRVATAILSGQLFGEIRSRRNLTYAVDAPFVERAVASGGLYVTTVAPDTVIALMRESITALQQGTIDPDALERLVGQFITEYFLDNETNGDQADLLARSHLFRGDYRAADRFVSTLHEVTPLDVQRAARRWMRDVQFAYIGDPARLSARSRRGF
jgi:zinc protease